MTDLAKYTKELSKLLSAAENTLIISHINPDGDAIGAQLALYHYLKTQGKNVSMITPNNIQEYLKWMDGAELLNVFIRDRGKCKKIIEKADLIVMLDFNHPNRMGEAEELVMGSHAKKIVIDHHLDPENFADLIISDPSKCSTSELLHELVSLINGVQFLNKPYAEALYVGIVTDTGNFEYGSYSSRTFRIVADLFESGLEKDRILNLIYSNFSSDRLRLQGYALNQKMVVLPEFKSAYISLTKEDLKAYNHVKGDTEGFVNIPLSIKGIYFSTLFIEKDGFVKLSFRSTGKFPTNEFASLYFSGGGHMNASGGEYYDTLDNTISYFLKVLAENVWRFEETK
ncbi:MAG TPA: DHH family phosphoesterase [Bacteroidales bacterium]|nr:DHH family phosphoesterase [Bacteroidales bacterium]HPT21012.1 DHH family phosphoesterase [Bacteroidales bacterium]